MPQAVRRLRILHVLPALGIAGAEQMVAHLTLHMRNRHTVGIVSLYPRTNSAIEAELEKAGITLWFLDKTPGLDVRTIWKLLTILNEFQPQVVHTHLHALRYALLPLMAKRVPVRVHTVHNLAHFEADSFGVRLRRVAFRLNVVPVAISSQVERSIRDLYGLSCQALIPNCIPVARYQSSEGELWRRARGFAKESVLLVWVARMEEQKNPLLLLRAFTQVPGSETKLLMVGAGVLRTQVRQFIEEQDLSRRVHLLGECNDIPACLAASDVFVLSSDWEGSPLAVIEAMAAGLPVVSTAVGGVPDLIGHGSEGLLVPRGDCASLAQAMTTLVRDADLRRSMGNRARARAEAHYDLPRMVTGYERLYETELKEREARPAHLLSSAEVDRSRARIVRRPELPS